MKEEKEYIFSLEGIIEEGENTNNNMIYYQIGIGLLAIVVVCTAVEFNKINLINRNSSLFIILQQLNLNTNSSTNCSCNKLFKFIDESQIIDTDVVENNNNNGEDDFMSIIVSKGKNSNEMIKLVDDIFELFYKLSNYVT